MSSLHSYPKVHVVGSGAYYSYRPITRFIEKADRSHIRENSSRPKDFSHYLAASSSVNDRPRKSARGSSLPPFDLGERAELLLPKQSEDDSFFSKNWKKDESIFKKNEKDKFFDDHPDTEFSKMSDIIKRTHEKHQKNPLFSHERRDKVNLQEENGPKVRRTAKELFDEKLFEKEREKMFGINGDDAMMFRLRQKHPFRLPVESEMVPPHDSSIWPENRAHFDLVSSYDTMVDYLGIREKSKN